LRSRNRCTYDPRVLTPALHRITAWLCLALALLAGAAPAQGFVLCVEPDGCVSVELSATRDHCGSCEVHVLDGVGAIPGAATRAAANCPCIDLTVPGSAEDRWLQPKSPDAPRLKGFAGSAAPFAPHGTRAPFLLRAPSLEVPRSPDSLRSIRSVVLLV
jgi:hypothetical protein